MATQNFGHPPINFSISTPFRHVRLMEVPEDVLDAITTRPDHQSASLKFKSAPANLKAPSTISGGAVTQARDQKEGILHLCSADKAWAVKQVSTSNSVYLIQPSRPLATEDRDDEPQDADTALRNSASLAVTAVAQVGNFLELHPVKLDKTAIEQAVIDLLPVHHPISAHEDIDLDLQASNDAKVPMSMDQLIDDVAAPDRIVKRACNGLGVYETTTNNNAHSKCIIPSTKALLDIWRKIIEGCAIEGIKLDHSISLVRIANVLVDEVESTIAEKLFEPGGLLDSHGLFEDGERKLKPEQTCQFVAGMILSSEPIRQMELTKFTATWTDLVPASFVKFCTLERLSAGEGSLFKLITGENEQDSIQWTGYATTSAVVYASSLKIVNPDSNGSSAAASKPTASSAAADKKRKWHEKFGAQRNAKK